MAINSLSASSKGFAGLASGLDTESMVEKLLSGTKTKITRQQQKKTQLTYKQDMYRGISSKLKSLQTTYLSYTNKTNLRSSTFFNSMTAKTTSSAFRVTGTSEATAGTTTVDRIEQLAKAKTVKSSGTVSGELSGAFNENAYDRFVASMDGTLMVTVGDETKKINISSLAGLGNEQAQDELNRLLEAEGINVRTEYKNGSFAFTSTTGAEFKLKGEGGGTKLLGAAGELKGTNGSLTTKLDTDALLPSLKVKLDGVEKTIFFNPLDSSGNISADSVAASLQKAITNAHGGGVTVSAVGQKIKFTTSDSSRQLTISGTKNSLDIIGISNGASNKISTTTTLTLNKLSFKEALIGDEYKFTINGVNFTIGSDRSMSSVISEINSSKANVRVTFNAEEDKFTMTSTVSGASSDITISQEQGNLMSAMFGVEGAESVSGKTLIGVRSQLPGGDAFTSKGGTFTLKIDGVEHQFTVPEKSGGKTYTASELVNEMNAQLLNVTTDDNKAASKAARTAGVQFAYDVQKGEVTMTVKAGKEASLVASDSSSLLRELGFSGGETTKVKSDSTLGELGMRDPISIELGGTTKTFTDTTTLSEVQTALKQAVEAEYTARGETVPADFKVEFDESSARFRIFGIDIPMEFKVSGDDGALFGTDTVTFKKAGTETVTAGQNAKLMVNGTAIERNSNSFTLNGLQFELTSTTQQVDANGDLMFKTNPDGSPVIENGQKVPIYEKASKVDVTRDTEQIFEGISKFVTAYNEVMREINKLTGAEPTYKDYEPLTDEQKAELSDKEVELWEAKSKEGLLRGDSILYGIMSDLRSQLYQTVEGSPLRLSDIGINTVAYNSDDKEASGTLMLTADTLRKMINENAEGISKLFTAPGVGLGDRLEAALSRATSASPASPGSLVRVAGSGVSDKSSTIYKQIREINLNLLTLKDRYESEYNRYWKQFNSMEQVIQNMNQQSSWLASQFSA